MIDTNEMPNGSSMAAVAPVLSERVKQLQLAGRMDGDKKGGGSNAWLPWILCVLMAIAWASVGLRYYRGNPAAPGNAGSTPAVSATNNSPGNPQTPSQKKDATKPASTNPDEVLLDAKGYIIPAHSLTVSPIEVSGKVIKLEIEEGKAFKKGDVLAVIEDTSYKADFEEAKAQFDSVTEKWNEMKNGSRPEEIEQARAELEEAKANMKQYKLEWDRYQGKSFDVISRRDFDSAESNYRSGEARISRLTKSLKLMEDGPRAERKAGAEADVRAAKARMDRSAWRLKNCTILSPVDGVILTKKAEIGNLVNPVVGGASPSLCDIADLSDLEVDMEIQERDIAKVFDGQYVRIKSDAYPDRSYEGYVDRSMPIANRARGIIPVRIKVIVPKTEKQGQYLKPDMGVGVIFFNKKYDKLPETHPAAAKQ